VTLKAVIFDVDGTIADTELHGHRVAFNRAFEEHGLPYRWEPEPYGILLELPGGEARIERYLLGQGHEPAEAAALAATLQARKQEWFLRLLSEGAVPLRSGIARLLDELLVAGVPVGVATTGGRVWVLELLRTLLGDRRADAFGAVVTGEDVAVKKPDPEAYHLALDRLGCTAAETVAIEDSAVGLRAARAAGLACLIARNAYTRNHDFTGADLVIEELGDEPGGPVAVIDNPHGIDVEPVIGIATLRGLRAAAS
jgi:HAD superfamily hydrolase (TIGR01509 family)